MMSEEVCGNHALLQCLAEGTLSPHETQAVKAHVAVCPPCRRAVTEYKQIMWDLEHPPEIELPPELEHSYEALMAAWRKESQGATRAQTRGSWLPSWSIPAWALPSWTIPSRVIPSWAAHSVAWTRALPGLTKAGSFVRRTGSALIERTLPRWMRGKGGGRD